MMIPGPHTGRELIRLTRIEFDPDEELSDVTLIGTAEVYDMIAEVIGRRPTYRGELSPVRIALGVPEIRKLTEHYARPETPKTPEADAIFNRMIVILGTFREDLL